VHRWVNSGGSAFMSNNNAVYGYETHVKPRWQQKSFEYQDPAALEKFGLDPLHGHQSGVVNQADSYGYPVDGYTTGYTVKLPPPADLAAAERTPRSFNIPQVVEACDGVTSTNPVPGDNPVDWINWVYATGRGDKKLLQQARQRAPPLQPTYPVEAYQDQRKTI
jgi:hypothetical protein